MDTLPVECDLAGRAGGGEIIATCQDADVRYTCVDSRYSRLSYVRPRFADTSIPNYHR